MHKGIHNFSEIGTHSMCQSEISEIGLCVS